MKFTYLVVYLMLVTSQIALHFCSKVYKMKQSLKKYSTNMLEKSVYVLKHDSNNSTEHLDNIRNMQVEKNKDSNNTSSFDISKNEYRLSDVEINRESYSNVDYSNIQKIIVQKDVQINNLNQEIYNLNKKIQILERKSSENESLIIKLDTLKTQNKEFNSELKIKQSYIELLEQKYSLKSQVKENPINNQNTNLNSDSYQDKKTIEILENRIKHLESSLEKFEIKLKEKEEIIKNLQNENNRSKCSEQEIKITQISTENIKLNKTIEEINIQLTEITKKYNIIVEEKKKCEASCQCDTNKKELSECKIKITSFEIEIKNLKITIENKTSELENCKKNKDIPQPVVEPLPPVPKSSNNKIDIPHEPIPEFNDDLNFNICLSEYLISIKKDAFLCLKSDIIQLKSLFYSKCPSDSSSNFVLNALKSVKTKVFERTPNRLKFDDDKIYLNCFLIIKEFYIRNTNQILCNDENSYGFFRIYEDKCEEKSKKPTQKKLGHDFITSMASVHKNSIADRELYSRLNKGDRY